MSRAVQVFGKPKTRSVRAPIVNRDGYPAWVRPLEEQCIQTLTTNTFGNTFYADAKDLAQEAEQVCDAMLAQDSEFAAKAIVYARNFGFMRTQPIYWLAKLSSVNGEAFERIFPSVIRTPNDLRDFAVMIASLRNGSQGGRRIKRAVGQWLVDKMSEYWVIKYGSENKTGFSLKDMLIAFHPNAGKQMLLFDYIMGRVNIRTEKGNVRRTFAKELPQLAAFEALKVAKTAEEKITAITEGRLPHEVATSFAGSYKTVWDAIVPQLPVFALLKNLATLERHDVMKANRKEVIAKLTDAKTIQHSKILPFRFLEAIKHVQDSKVQDALRDAVDLSFANIPDIEGRTAVFLDISGSMQEHIQTAALFACCAMKKANNEGRFLLFDTSVDEVRFSMRDSVLSQAEKIHTRGGTDTGAPMQQLLREKDKVDVVLLITDEQQNTGSPFVDVLDKYKASVNPKVKTFILDVNAYRSALTPDGKDKGVYFMYGWSPSALSFISLASKGWGTMVEAVKRGDFGGNGNERNVTRKSDDE